MAEKHVNIFTSHDMPKRNFKYFEELRNKKELCDITIQVGSESIPAHRIIVIAVIPYFRDSLTVKSEGESIVLPDIDPSALKCLIEFAYSCEVRINEENVESLLSAACHLRVDEVRDACLDFLWNKLEPKNALSVREVVGKLNCSDLLTKIDCYVRKNFDRVSQTEDFMQCPFSYFKELIEKDDLNVTEEEKVFEIVMNWIKASPSDRAAHLPELLTNVRMVFLKPLYLVDIVHNEGLIRTSLVCRDLIDEARNYISFPETRKDICSFKTEPRKSMTAYERQEKRNVCVWKLNHQLQYTVQHFGVADRKWVTEKPKSLIANDGSAVEMDNKMYFFRWGDTLEYNPTNNGYKIVQKMPTPRTCVGLARLKNTIYVCGGKVNNGVASDAVECFNPEVNMWSKISSMPKSVWGASAVALEDHIFVLGGQDDSSMYNSVERYDPVMDKWEHMPSMNVKRNFAGAAVLNGKIYVCGGNTALRGIAATATAEVYDPVTRSWKTITNMNTARCLFTLLPFSEKLYAIGGRHDRKQLDYFEIYDTEGNKWTTGPSTDPKILTSGAVVMPVGCT